MRHLLFFLLGCAAVSTTNGAAAQERKFQLALRSGYSAPMGTAASSGNISVPGYNLPINSDMKMGDYLTYRVPIWVDAGYMITPSLLLGVYFQYGFVGTKTNDRAPFPICSTGTSCSAHDIHFGIQAQYYFTPGSMANPWLGLGIGRESLALTAKRNGTTTDVDFSGWTFALLQTGLDFAVSDAFALGPFAAFSLGRYTSATLASGGISTDVNIPAAMHEWLTLGVKGQLGL